MCPYLRVGELQTSCAAYMGPYTEPSECEQEYYCSTCSHSGCVWFLSKRRELIHDSKAMHTSAFAGAEQIARVFAHSEI